MEQTIVNVVVFAPLAVAALILLIGCIGPGRKMGSKVAAITVGLTVVSAAISVVITKLIVARIAKVLPDVLAGMELDAPPALYGSLAVAAESMASLLLFGFVFLVCSLVIRIIGGICTKKMKKAETAGEKAGGAGIIALDVLLFCFFLFLPLYGTLSVVKNAQEAVQPLGLIEEDGPLNVHLPDALDVVREEPIRSIVDVIASVKTPEGRAFSAPAAVNSLRDAVSAYQELDPNAEKPTAGPAFRAFGDAATELAHRTPCLADGLLSVLASGEWAADGSSEGASDVTNRFMPLLQKLLGQDITDKAELKQASDSWGLLGLGIRSVMTTGDDADSTKVGAAYLLEGLARHPFIGTDGAADALKGLLPAGEDGEAVIPESLLAPIIEKLKETCAAPVEESTFRDYLLNTLRALEAFSGMGGEGEGETGSMTELITADKEVLASVFGMLSEDNLTSMGLDEKQAKRVSGMVNSLQKELETRTFTPEQAEKEGEALAYALNILTNVNPNATKLSSIIPSPDEFVEKVAGSDLIPAMLGDMVASDGRDPLGAFGKLSASDKKLMSGALSKYGSAHGTEEGVKEKLNTLASFLGLPAVN